MLRTMFRTVFILERVFIEPDNGAKEIVGVFSSVDEAQEYYDINHKYEARHDSYYTDGKYIWDYLLWCYPLDRMTPISAGNKKYIHFRK